MVNNDNDKIAHLPDPHLWEYHGVEGCMVAVRIENRPTAVDSVNYLLDMAKRSLLDYAAGGEG